MGEGLPARGGGLEGERLVEHVGDEEEALDALAAEVVEEVRCVEAGAQDERAAERGDEAGEGLRGAVVEAADDHVALACDEGEPLEDGGELGDGHGREVAHGALRSACGAGGVDDRFAVVAGRIVAALRGAEELVERGDGFAEGSAVFVGSFEAVDVEEGDGAVVEGCGGGGGDGQRLAARADELCAAVAEHMVELGGAEFEGGVDGGGAEPEQREPEDEVLDPVLRHEDDPAPGGDVETAAEKRGDPVDRLIHLGVGEHPFEVADGDAAGLLGGHDAVQVFERRPLPAERAVALDGVAGELVEQAGLLEHGEGVGRSGEVLAEPFGMGADAPCDEVEEVHSVTQRLARQTAAGAGPQRQAEVESELQERLS